MDKFLEAVKQKFEHYVVHSFVIDNFDFESQKNDKSFTYYFQKITDETNELPYNIQQKVREGFNEYERQEFDNWWTFNGDEYEKEYLKKHNDASDMLLDAYEEWSDKNENDIYNEYYDQIQITKHVVITVEDNGMSNMDITIETYFESYDFKDMYKETYKSQNFLVEKEYFDNRMIEALNGKSELFKEFCIIPSNEQSLDYFTDNYKISKIARKICGIN